MPWSLFCVRIGSADVGVFVFETSVRLGLSFLLVVEYELRYHV